VQQEVRPSGRWSAGHARPLGGNRAHFSRGGKCGGPVYPLFGGLPDLRAGRRGTFLAHGLPQGGLPDRQLGRAVPKARLATYLARDAISPSEAREAAAAHAHAVAGRHLFLEADIAAGSIVAVSSTVDSGSLPLVAWADLSAGDHDEGDSGSASEADPVGFESVLPAVAAARCTGTSSCFGLLSRVPRRAGPRRRASQRQVEVAMQAAGEHIPRLVRCLAFDEQLGLRMLRGLISNLVAARVPAALRRDFSSQALVAARTPGDVLFFMRMSAGSGGVDDDMEDVCIELLSGAVQVGVDEEAEGESSELLWGALQDGGDAVLRCVRTLLHMRLPGEVAECSSSAHEVPLSDGVGCDVGPSRLFEIRDG